MQRHLSQPFKTKYLERLRDDTSTDFMSFSMSSTEPVRTKQHVCTEIRREPLNIGFTGSSPEALPDFMMGIAQGAQPGSLPMTRTSCEMTYGVLPGNWDMTKTSGMVCCCLTTSRRTTPFFSVCGNVKGYSTSLDSVSRGLAARLAKPIRSNRRPSKKLPAMDERPHHPALVRGRSPFPAAQQPDQDVGPEGTATSCALTFGTPQGGLLRGTQPENWMSTHQRGSHFQCRDLWRLCPLSSSIYSRKTIPYSGQCQMAQSARFERLLRCESGPAGTHLPAAIFPRTQSSGTSMEDYSPKGNPQSLFPIGRRTQIRFNFSFYKMEATEQRT
jgi:hypothetical protein